MKKWRLLVAATALAPLAMAAAPAAKPAAEHHGMAMEKGKMSDAQIIASAMKAAPAAVGEHAAVVAANADGTMREVRKGTNGFTCMADEPSTPGPDPMCLDANAMKWVEALLGHKEPPADTVGLMYMLAGGTDASNTDPYATKPSKENHWINTGPHVMVVGSKSLLAGYPHDADPNTKTPYVMWSGTPYEHLMIPVH
jgi:hypothetical protein